uniref:Uncharacterized protein n=1 Tax=Arundo donax TaxID=35708 RepID=A0A0A9BWX6_ARUDO
MPNPSYPPPKRPCYPPLGGW